MANPFYVVGRRSELKEKLAVLLGEHGFAMYEKSLHVNINLWIGLTMLVFGGIMLLLALRKKKKN